MKTIITENGISYVLCSDGMYYPALKYDTSKHHYGKYGLLRKRFLQEHQKGYYTALLLRGKPIEHLNQIDNVSNARMDFLVSPMQFRLLIDESLKSHDQMTWVYEMNNIYAVSEDIVLKKFIYS